MIGRLQGKILHKGPDWILLDVSGVGYKIFVLPKILRGFDKKEAIFFTHLYVREDMLNLYGFLTEDELTLFELLISVSGIGPKAAMGILSVGDPQTIEKSIAEGRSDLLMGVSGVGRKTADRAILELRSKIQAEGSVILPKALTPEDEEVIDALVNLGYKKSEASKAVLETSHKATPEEKVKESLKRLGK